MYSIKRLYHEECGQDMVEYGLLASLISIAALATVRFIGPLVNNFYVIVRNAIA
jgi:Flp pilus assembly pilin Flp